MSQTSWFGSAQAIRMFLRICGGSPPRFTWPTVRELRATSVAETHLGRSWQRWSRHFSGGQWQSGVDGLESFLALIRQNLERNVLESTR